MKRRKNEHPNKTWILSPYIENVWQNEYKITKVNNANDILRCRQMTKKTRILQSAAAKKECPRAQIIHMSIYSSSHYLRSVNRMPWCVSLVANVQVGAQIYEYNCLSQTNLNGWHSRGLPIRRRFEVCERILVCVSQNAHVNHQTIVYAMPMQKGNCPWL